MKWSLIKTYNGLINYNGPGRVNPSNIDYFFNLRGLTLYLKAVIFSYYLTSIEKGKLKKPDTFTIVKFRDLIIRFEWVREIRYDGKYNRYGALILSPERGPTVFTLIEEIEELKSEEDHKGFLLV